MVPRTEKAVPVRVAELMVTGRMPEDFNVNDCVDGVPTVTSPKDKLVALKPRLAEPPLGVGGAAGFSCMTSVCETPPALAVSVTDCVLLTVDTTALNPVVVAPVRTVTADGTETNWLSLERLTTNGLVAGALKVTVHAFVSDELREGVPQETALSVGTSVVTLPMPARPTTAIGEVAESLFTVSLPVCGPLVAGMKCTSMLSDPPGVRVAGRIVLPSR